MTRLIPCWAVIATGLLPGPATFAAPTAEQTEFFEKKVRPILAEHCFQCHGEKKQMAGLRLDTATGVQQGSDGGPIVIAGQPAKSKLLTSVQRTGEYPMPPNKPIPADAVAILAEWVRLGTPFPTENAPKIDPATVFRKHWAFQPVREPALPPARPGAINAIDRFILARLADKGLTLSPTADRRTLIRRVYFDVIGLPPTVQQVEAFAADSSPNAYERLIDELLASPHYGERWARHWLDVARYADTKGYVFQEDRNYPYAYTYRDYVIRSFNTDKPYNQFILEQLAADHLDLGADRRPLAALGFLTVGRRFLNNTHDIIDDRIDVVTRGLMGLTVACARCHDHKYDPIPIGDYYSLYGVFASCVEPKDLPQIGEEDDSPAARAFRAEIEKKRQELAQARVKRAQEMEALLRGLASGAAILRGKYDHGFNRADRDRFNRMQTQIDALVARSPYTAPRAMVLNDREHPFAPRVFLRGNPATRGDVIPRQFLQVVAGPDRVPFPKNTSGRLELARAIADPQNPLTARVLVNRVWGWHFGRGFVATPSDFGIRSEPPTHPELLDWLASRFVAEGWSLKKLHRLILLSATYRQSSTAPQAERAIQVDPENRWLGRQNRRRLEWEPLRDAMLVVAGRLDATVGGRSVDLFRSPYPLRRAVYGFVDRQNLPGTFRAFDFAGPDTHAPLRYQTTVPQQALFLMNNPFVTEQAAAIVARKDVATAKTPDAKLDQLYRVILARSPTLAERELGLAFVKGSPNKPQPGKLNSWEMLAQVVLLSNAFAFVD
ncbi:MAG: PSD1 and planctomycete cytochrome C domain-containing protein [Bacteroidales bacterium]|nr:PSD1 and planctomycete cytochrome C domain-containing protein [Bacteroidales bacterium]